MKHDKAGDQELSWRRGANILCIRRRRTFQLQSIFSRNACDIKRWAHLMRGLWNAVVKVNKEANLVPQTE